MKFSAPWLNYHDRSHYTASCWTTSVVLPRSSVAMRSRSEWTQAYNLRGRAERPLISVVTVGEGRSFALQRGWARRKWRRWTDCFMSSLSSISNNAAVLDKYAQIDAYMKKNGGHLGKNDVWIAATAAVTGALLLTNEQGLCPRLIHCF